MSATLTVLSAGWVLATTDSEPEGTRRMGGAQILPHPWWPFLHAGARGSGSALYSVIPLFILPFFTHPLPPSMTQSLYATHSVLQWLPIACGRKIQTPYLASKPLYGLVSVHLCKLISSHSPPHSDGTSGVPQICTSHPCPRAFALAISSA